MDKLKNIDWKQLGVNHGEKLGAVIVALLAGFVLFSSEWTTEKLTVTQLKNQANDTLLAMQQNDWPKSKDEAPSAKHGQWEFQDIDPIVQRATYLGKAVGFDRYEFTTQLTWPTVPPRKKRSKLDLTSPESLVVALVKGSIAQKNEDAEDKDESEDKDEDDKDSEDGENPFDFKGAGSNSKSSAASKGRGLGSPGGGGNLGGGLGDGLGGGLGDGLGGGLGDGLGGGPGDKPGGKNNRSLGGGGGGAGDMPGMPGSGGLAGGPLEFKAVGERMVAVRGIVDIYKQREQMARSFHLPITDALVQESLQYLDYQVQRQAAIPGADPWSGEWEDVDIQVAIDLIRNSDGRDDEVVNRDVVSDVFTMPLPPRLVRKWRKEASHPRIENYTLSKSQVDRQRKKDEIIRQFYEEFLKKQENAKKKKRKGGWAPANVDLKNMENAIKKDKQTFDKFKEELRKQGVLDEEETASGNLLLFRYFDSSIEQGKTYRYRVRLELENPHYGVTPDELEEFSLAERETLWTDWSEPSAAVTIPYDYQYFVHEVSDGVDAHAEVNMFLWYHESGTDIAYDDEMNRSGLKVRVGDFVGGKKKTYVLRMDRETLNKEEVLFETKDILLSVTDAPNLDANLFPELKDEISAMGRARNSFGTRMTVARPDGDIITVSSRPNDGDLSFKRRFMKALHNEYSGWRDQDGGTGAARRNSKRRNNNPGSGNGYGDYGNKSGGAPPPGYGGSGSGGPPPGYGGSGMGGPPPGYGGGGGQSPGGGASGPPPGYGNSGGYGGQ